MIWIVRRFAGDQRGFCASEYALAAFIGVTLAVGGAHRLQAKTADSLAVTNTSFLDVIKNSGRSEACKI